MTKVSRREVFKHPAGWFASGFGAGLSPIGPGTVGSAVALVPYLWLRMAEPWVLVAAIVATFLVGVWCAGWIIGTLKVEDPGIVVIDEFVGQWIALGMIEAAIVWFALDVPPLWLLLTAGFVAFRVCDILKPWPVGWADEKLSGGFGAMADDALAGVLAGLLGSLAFFFLGRFS